MPGSKKGQQHVHNEKTKKYVRQRARTEARKDRKRAEFIASQREREETHEMDTRR